MVTRTYVTNHKGLVLVHAVIDYISVYSYYKLLSQDKAKALQKLIAEYPSLDYTYWVEEGELV